MNLLFWNLARHDNAELAIRAIKDKDADIAILAEHGGIDAKAIVDTLGPEYREGPSQAGCDKIKSIMKSNLERQYTDEQSRHSVNVIKDGSGKSFVIAMTHLTDKRSDPDSSARMYEIRQLMAMVRAIEKSKGCEDIVIIGDLNANPYDSELLQPDAFNAVLFKDVIRKTRKRTWQGHEFEYLYNPILNWLSEDPKMYGSFYLSSPTTGPHWNCLDQVLVSPSLMDKVADVEYMRSIGDTNLLAQVGPKKCISDHLPLFVTIR